MTKNNFVSSIKVGDLQVGHMRGVRVKGKPVLLARVDSEVYAVSNTCPHAGCEFQGGILTGYMVMCSCHGWKFDIRNGQSQANPLTKLESYPCKIENGKIQIEINR